ncbi:hypothetical protein DB346_07315 [Verrucomicrobia bacterium LW23]|nr:hypothetical protein DB346_07315 [Verrucomicrobia bacterium LW23]
MNSTPDTVEHEDLADEASLSHAEEHAHAHAVDPEQDAECAPVHVEGDHLRAITTAVSNLMADRQRVDDHVGELASRLEYWYQHVLKLGEVLGGMQQIPAGGLAMPANGTPGGSTEGSGVTAANGADAPPPLPANVKRTTQTQSLRSGYSTTQSLSHIASRRSKGGALASTVGRTSGRITTNLSAVAPGATGSAGAPAGGGGGGASPVPGLGTPGVMMDAACAQKLNDLYDEAAGFATEVAGMLGYLLEERAAFHQTARQISLQLNVIQSVAAGGLLNRLALAFKAEADKLDHPIGLALEGEDIPVDKPLLEELYTPMLELMRHIMQRGIEDSQTRMDLEKSKAGTISITVRHEGTRIVIRMEDDGWGIDPDELYRHALEQKKISPKATWDPTLCSLLLCSPEMHPLSEEVTRRFDPEALGWIQRGIHRLRGSISVDGAPGRGATWTICLPISALTCEGAIFDVGGVPVAVSSMYVQGGFQLDETRIEWREGRPWYPGPNGYPVELWRLDALLGMAPTEPAPTEGVYLDTDGITLAVAVHKILGCRDVAVKPFMTLPEHHPLFSCAAQDLNGKILLVANVPGLFQARFAMMGGAETEAAAGTTEAAAAE